MKLFLSIGILLALSLMLPFSYAQIQADTRLDESFQTTSGFQFVPPPIDGEDHIEILLLTSDTGDVLLPHHLEYELLDPVTKEKQIFLSYIDSGLLLLESDFEDYIITLKADYLGTPGKDYYGEGRVAFNESVYLFPAGSLQGEITNNKDEVVRNADIKLSCTSLYAESQLLESDEFGFFKADWLPPGSCKVYATKNNYVGSATVNITQGGLIDIQVELTRDLETDSLIPVLLLVLAVLLVIIILYFQKVKNRFQSSEKRIKEFTIPSIKTEKTDAEKTKISQRAKDIMQTLNEKEHKVVSYLLEKDCEVSQSVIRHEFRIPKTTLSRLIESLQRKKIIDVRKVGKIKKVCLTDFFKGK